MIFQTPQYTRPLWAEKNKFLKFVFIILLFPPMLCCNNQHSGNSSEVPAADTAIESIGPASQPQNDSIKIVVNTFLENKEWGYDIVVDDKLYIHQPNIPSVSGNNGFKTKEDALKTGEFVAYKIRNHILPPTVTPEQLDSLGVIEKK